MTNKAMQRSAGVLEDVDLNMKESSPRRSQTLRLYSPDSTTRACLMSRVHTTSPEDIRA